MNELISRLTRKNNEAEEKMQYMEDLIKQLVRGIEDMHTVVTGMAAIAGRDIPADSVCDQLDALLRVDAPDGKPSTLVVDDDEISIVNTSRLLLHDADADPAQIMARNATFWEDDVSH
jgi:hypothetical protein